MALSDRIVVMNGGRAEQVGRPDEIYNRPASRFVAEFIGALNLLPATLRDAATGQVDTALGPVRLNRAVAQPPGSALTLAFRPESLRLIPTGEDHAQAFTGRLVAREFLGAIVRLRAEMARDITFGIDCFNRGTTAALPDPGGQIRVGVSPEDILLLS
jgi:putative spermidine/putrescine transport system ATP-binding protein